jgi:protease II
VILDVNALADGKAFMSSLVGGVSPVGNRLIYAADDTGLRQYTLQIKDLRTGKLESLAVPRVTSAEWGEDDRTLLYSVGHPQTKRSYRVYRHVLGETRVLPRVLLGSPTGRVLDPQQRPRSQFPAFDVWPDANPEFDAARYREAEYRYLRSYSPYDNIDRQPAGHGGRSGRFDRLREKAFEYAFPLWQLGAEAVPGR